MQKKLYIGVDLGQRQDYSAISVIDQVTLVTGPRNPVTYDYPRINKFIVRHLERAPLGSEYTAVVERIRHHVSSIAQRHACDLVVDATGVGAPVVSLLKEARLNCRLLVPVQITSGHQVTRQGGFYYVPKRDLIVGLQILMERGELEV